MPFDEEEIDTEFETLRRSSSVDAAKLEFCVGRVEDVASNVNPSPALIWTFDDGLKELRHENGRYKGRLLFYEPPTEGEVQELVILAVFRKQTQKTPKSEINKALNRMQADLKRRSEREEDL